MPESNQVYFSVEEKNVTIVIEDGAIVGISAMGPGEKSFDVVLGFSPNPVNGDCEICRIVPGGGSKCWKVPCLAIAEPVSAKY